MPEIRSSFCSRCGSCLTDRPGVSVEARGPGSVALLVVCPACAESFERWVAAGKGEPVLELAGR